LAADAGPVPTALVACTVTLYVVPAVPVKEQEVAAPTGLTVAEVEDTEAPIALVEVTVTV
jgi:hypothetical protein